MNHFHAYLNFDGNCAAAMRFYEKALGGKLEALMTGADAPASAQCHADHPERVVHACLKVGDSVLMAGDAPAGLPYRGKHGFGLTLNYPTVTEAKKAFEALADGGQVGMPLAKTFWAEAFGMVTDRFGTPWLINGALTAN